MKNDPTFKLVALAILAGVIVAFVTPAHSGNASHDTAPETAPAALTE